MNAFPLSEFSNQAILLKGARVFEFEQVSRLLQEKVHETMLEINLDALIKNLNYFKTKVPANTKVMAMVKAFSYGSGGFEIANMLQFHQVDYLAVAYADEGVELRKAGINLPIMVMNPEEFDVIVSDIRMPGVTGLSVLAGLRGIEGTPPIILISAFGDEETHAEARELGAAALLDKPFEMSDLLDRVRDAISSRA